MGILKVIPLMERLPILACLDYPNPHIPMLWSLHYMVPSFMIPTPEDGRVIVVDRDVIQGNIKMEVEVIP